VRLSASSSCPRSGWPVPPRRRVAIVTAASEWNEPAARGDDEDEEDAPPFVGAPGGLSPRSPSGQLLAHVLSSEPHLFASAVEATLDRISDDLDREEGGGSIDVGDSPGAGAASGDRNQNVAVSSSSDDGGLVLFQRLKEMRALERRNAIQDVMYASILQKFLTVGVDMLPPLDDEVIILRGVDLTQLTNGVHSVEALAMVKDHLLGMLGPEASAAYSNSLVRMSKLQAAQMYAASIMFGYFLRKADKRFSLDRAAGTLPLNPMESALALEAMFNSASAMDSEDEADMSVQGMDMGGFGEGVSANANFAETYDANMYDVNASGSDRAKGAPGRSTTLKQYIQSFDRKALADTARIVSLEGVVLAERQTGALFGSVEELAQEMQSALQEGGQDITTQDELMSRVKEVVGSGKVKTVTINISTQRRVVLEAVAFGSYLRDVETYVDGCDGRLLTPAPSARGPSGNRGPPGMIGSSK